MAFPRDITIIMDMKILHNHINFLHNYDGNIRRKVHAERERIKKEEIQQINVFPLLMFPFSIVYRVICTPVLPAAASTDLPSAVILKDLSVAS